MHGTFDLAALQGIATVARSGARTKRPSPPRRGLPAASAPPAGKPSPPSEPAPAPPAGSSVEELATGWRAALDAADGALRAAHGSLSPEEVSSRSQGLLAERATTLQLLRAVGRERGVPVRFLHLVPRRDLPRILDLPGRVAACVFELDGVLVASAELHVAAWQQTFDEFLVRRPEVPGRHLAPFHPQTDYPQHIHGKPRVDGVIAFLASRGVSLPLGAPADSPGTETIHGLANRKNEVLVHLIDVRGVRSFEGSRHYLEAVVEAGLRTAVVSASANSERMLARVGLSGLVDERIDGRTMTAQHLRKRPAPDVLLAACRALGVEPGATAVFETTSAGVAAARAAECAFVVAVDRGGRAPSLRAAGADVVTPDLGVLLESRLPR